MKEFQMDTNAMRVDKLVLVYGHTARRPHSHEIHYRSAHRVLRLPPSIDPLISWIKSSSFIPLLHRKMWTRGILKYRLSRRQVPFSCALLQSHVWSLHEHKLIHPSHWLHSAPECLLFPHPPYYLCIALIGAKTSNIPAHGRATISSSFE